METKKKIKFLVDCINTNGDHFGYEDHFPCEVTIDFGFEVDEEEETILIRDFKEYLSDVIGGGFDACHIMTEDELEGLIFQEELDREP